MTLVDRVRIAIITLLALFGAAAAAGWIGYQSARADTLTAQIAPAPVAEPPLVNVTPRPSDALPDPMTNLGDAIDSVTAARHVGWALALLGALIMLARTALVAGRRWPDVAWLAWLNAGRRGFAIAGIAAIAAAAYDALALGGTWLAVVFAAFGALLALLQPSPSRGA